MPDPRSAVTDIPIPRFPFLGGLLPLRLRFKAAEKKGTRERNGGPGNEEWRPGLRFRQCYSAEFIVIGKGAEQGRRRLHMAYPFSRYVIEMASARLCRMWWNAQTGNIPITESFFPLYILPANHSSAHTDYCVS